MCVITLVETVRPTDEQVRQMFEQNPKGGGGAAWREVVDGKKMVHWKKGLTKDQMVEINKELPFPYVLHFRQPSHDTSQSLLACHPFQIDDQATTGFEGTFEGWVLFHNGSWGGWRSKLESFLIASGGRLKGPSGAWSDTRALAFLANYMGFVFLEAINEKVIAFGPDEWDIEQFGGPFNDVKVPGTEGTITVSNLTWQRVTTTPYVPHGGHGYGHSGGGYARNETSKTLAAAQAAIVPGVREGGGASQPTSFRREAGATEGHAGATGDLTERVQTPSQGIGFTNDHIGALIQKATRQCVQCKKVTPVGNVILGQYFCLQCWATANKSGHASPLKWIGTCGRCKVQNSGMKTVLGDEWLCHDCWTTNGKPKIYFAKERHTDAA